MGLIEHFSLAQVVFFVLALTIPAWVLGQSWIRTARDRRERADNERALAELQANALRMEARLRTLERILDADAPGWRERV